MNLPAHATMTANAQSILVVDDDPEIRKLLARYIESQGFRVLLAANCRELRDQLATHHIDLIVLDVMLPDINGKEVCQRVRSDKSMDDVRIICISGMVEEDKVSELKAAGANDFMHKPFEVERLVERMCRHLDIEMAASA